jgi:repressor LexA
MTELTQRQQAVLDFIRRFRQANGFSPSFAEIAREFSIHLNGAVRHLRALQTKGFVRWTGGTARSLVIVDEIAPLEKTDPAVR